MSERDFDIIVVGGGHAGVEAALAASRMGRQVAMVSMDKTKLALMSCNPAVGGVGKSQLVKEIDALGGLIGQAADAAGIQFRRLNLSRGPAVWSTRIQVDRAAYNQYVVQCVQEDPRVTVLEGMVSDILIRDDKVTGVKLSHDQKVSALAVIICSGTFLGGLIHIGEKQIQSGRLGEPGVYALTDSLKSLGFEIGRLKTGTPPRLDGDTIDWSLCAAQPGEAAQPRFSYRSIKRDIEQANCYLTYTTARTKEIVDQSRLKSPMFSGQIQSTGPRYCPSIEDKFYRFADKDRHQVFLEPEGNGTNDIYPNGFSTALPEQVQVEAMRSIDGLSEVRFTQPGYAIEYDYCPANQIRPTMETRRVAGLSFAGQINGTSGYEEAAAQGLLAGINAVLRIESSPPFVPDRSEAYLGVLIDDLTTRSTTEPYRMFTSRAEYRLALREDNARDRLTNYAERYGLVPKSDIDSFRSLQQDTESAIARLKKKQVRVSDLGEYGERFQRTTSISLENLLKQPNVFLDDALDLLVNFDGNTGQDREVLRRAAIFIRYFGYIDKQQREIYKFKAAEAVLIPDNFDYDKVSGLKTEARQKLKLYRPASLGQAGRIEGITPGDTAVLSIFVFRQNRGGK